MRTPEQILARIEACKADDWMGTITGDLMLRLPYEMAKPYLAEGITKETFEEAITHCKEPLPEANGYLDFAWDKANNCRGISAVRSLEHLSAWLWLAGYGSIVDAYWYGYTCYGKQQLVIASILCDFDWRKHDDGVWRNGEDKFAVISDAVKAEQIRVAEDVAAHAKKEF